MRREVCRQARAWLEGGLGELRYSVNVSPIELAQDSFVDGLLETLEETCLPPRILDLEITERVLLQDCPEFRKHLTRLKDLGVSLSLDDSAPASRRSATWFAFRSTASRSIDPSSQAYRT
jgi:EAL domain-containing protein (putative c-di-GMP-specific phosphodiesterase class I)